MSIKINLGGIDKVLPEAVFTVLKGNRPDDTNTITDPLKIVPVVSTIRNVKRSFSKTLDSYSGSILELKIK